MANVQGLDALTQHGTEQGLVLLVRRRARRLDEDIVGSLMEATACLKGLRQLCSITAEAVWQQDGLAARGLSYRVEEFEPGRAVDRVGVAVYIVPEAARPIPRQMLKSIQHKLEHGVRSVRRRTHDLAIDQDLLIQLEDADAPWPGDTESMCAATVALVRASRQRDIFLRTPKGELPLDVGAVTAPAPMAAGQIDVAGYVDAHRWTPPEALIRGTQLSDTNKPSLAKAKRNFLIQVPDEKSMVDILQISASRARKIWKLDQFEVIVDGGEKRIEYRLAGIGP